MTRAAWAWLVAIALAGCGGKKEEQARDTTSEVADKAKAAASAAKDKAASALDRARDAVDTAKDKVGEAIELGADAADSLAQRAGILEDLDARIQRATERATAATTDAARSAARTSLDNLTKARAAIAKKIDELKAAGTYQPQP